MIARTRTYKSIAGHLRFCHKNVGIQCRILSTSTSKGYSETNFLSARQLQSIRREFAHLLQLPVFSEKAILYHQRIHGRIVVSGLWADVLLGNILMHLYSKLGRVKDAQLLFDKMPKRNLVSWSTMVTTYSQHGYAEEALMLFSDFMRGCDEKPNEFLLASVMRACAQIGMLELGTQVHDFVLKSGFIYNVYVGTAMIDFYAKLGKMDDARMVFDELKEKSLVTWTTIITGYCSRGQSDVSLELFHEMMGYANVVPDKYIISSVLSACSMLHYLEGGMQMHAYVLRRGSFMDVSVMNVLIDFYLKCGRVRHGRRLFDQFAVKDAISWTIMIAGYMQNSFDTDAVQLFSEMHKLGWTPDDFVCSSILTSCGSLEALVLGVQVHGYAIKLNLESDEFVKSSLIDMYSKCNSLNDARRAFDSVVHNNVVSYNAMIEGYSRQEKVEEALNLFHGMRHEMLQPSVLTFVSLLGASASLSALDLSKQIHGLVFKMGMRRNMFIISALIDVYCTCNFLQDARLVFEEINEKDVVVWNAMLFGYTRKLESEEALKLYNQLQEVGEKANEFTFVVMMNAASSLASFCHGQQFHSQLLKTGFDLDSIVRNALLDMYAKCGCLQDAHKLFNTTKKKDVACWNSMISTCANHGQAEQALSLYRQMLKEGVQPSYVTFVGLLSACSHAGLVEVGLEHFNTMLSYGIEPGTEHYACIVSVYGRAGKPTDAKEFIEKMPVKPAAIVWKSLLSSCQATGDFELGTYAAEKAISSDPADSGSYILLSNIYASKGMWAQVKKVRERMERNLVVKEPGCSWIELNDGAHVFVAKDKSHCKADLIFAVLDKLIQGIMGTGRKSIWSILSRPTWFFITEPWHFKNSVHTLSQCTRSQGFSCPRVKSGQRMLLHAHPLWIHHHVIMQVLWMTLPENPSSGVFKTPRGDELTLEYSCFACSTREVPLSVL